MDNQQLEVENTYYSDSSSNAKTLTSFRGVLPEDCYYSADEDFHFENEEAINSNLTVPSNKLSNSNRSNIKNINNFNLEENWNQKNILSGLENRYQDNFQGKNKTSNNIYYYEKSELDKEIEDQNFENKSNISKLSNSEIYTSDFNLVESCDIVEDDIDLDSCSIEKINLLLLKGSKFGNVQLVDQILSSSQFNVNVVNEKGFSALHWASLNGHSLIVKKLLEAKADPNVRTNMFCTPLHFSSANGFDEIVVMLLKAGAQPDVMSKLGLTPLFSASIKGYEGIVKQLLKYGANADVKNKQGLTPRDVAEIQGHSEILEILDSWKNEDFK